MILKQTYQFAVAQYQLLVACLYIEVHLEPSLLDPYLLRKDQHFVLHLKLDQLNPIN